MSKIESTVPICNVRLDNVLSLCRQELNFSRVKWEFVGDKNDSGLSPIFVTSGVTKKYKPLIWFFQQSSLVEFDFFFKWISISLLHFVNKLKVRVLHTVLHGLGRSVFEPLLRSIDSDSATMNTSFFIRSLKCLNG